MGKTEVVWQSTVTEEMTENLSQTEIDEMVEALNEAVAQICQEFDVE